ncbi:MFS transporter [Bifidobacterium biavatii]|uniref:Major facilitator transporter n=1 Tax=Bifidobacterium biavatii DSM 23969 TaxID=1437608 RepID=A0A086ZN90_9BIFI|nr:MFS transporter [Bifidobacterium biavatii]KFI47990.1 major facilitator transporter [Bifidobacterium biavatii DSM 23969]
MPANTETNPSVSVSNADLGISSVPAQSSKARSPWRTPHYAMWFTADTADVFADALQTFALPLIAFELSQSKFVAGALTTLSMIVMMVLTPIGGVIVDRHDRRTLMIGQGLGQLVVGALLAVCVATGTLNLPILVLSVLAPGVISGLLGASTDAILRSLIPTDLYAKAQSVREGREAGVGLLSSPISGVLYGLFAWLPMAVAAVISGVGAICSCLLPKQGMAGVVDDGMTGNDGADDGTVDAEASAPGDDVEAANIGSLASSFACDFAAGWKWSLTRRTLPWIIVFGAVINVAFAGLETGAQLMLIARGVSAFNIGLVFTGMGVCSLIGSLIAGRVSDRLATGHIVMLSSLLTFACFVPLVFDSGYGTVLVCLSLIGLLLPSLNASLFGFMYGRTSEDMQGRVSSVFETLVGVFGACAPFAAGWALQYLDGGFTIVAVAACALGLAALLIAALSPIRDIPTADRWEEYVL